MSDALDLDQDFGTSQVRYLYKGAGRKIAGKELATGLPYHLAVSYVCDEDRKFHDIGHFTSGRRQELPEFAENSLTANRHQEIPFTINPMQLGCLRTRGDSRYLPLHESEGQAVVINPLENSKAQPRV